MIDRYKGAELLTALWRLGGEPQGLPTSHGILDQALFDLRAVLPEPLNGLTFSQTGVGLRCFELPGILLAAQETMLTSEPNPTYLATNVTLQEDAARQIVVDAAVSTREARALGGRLRVAVQEVRDRIGSVSEPVAA